MAGMIAGVECARRRRFYDSPTSVASHTSTRRSFLCLYTSNHENESLPSSSLLRRSLLLYQAHPQEMLGGAAREAKERLDERFRARRKYENKSKQNGKEKLKSTKAVCLESFKNGDKMHLPCAPRFH